MRSPMGNRVHFPLKAVLTSPLTPKGNSNQSESIFPMVGETIKMMLCRNPPKRNTNESESILSNGRGNNQNDTMQKPNPRKLLFPFSNSKQLAHRTHSIII